MLRFQPGRAQVTNIVAFAICWTLAVFATVWATEGWASTPPASPRTILDRLQRRYQETKSFSAKFTEQIAPVGGLKREREGAVYFWRPGRMRWDFGGAERETIVCDGKDLYTYQPDLNQVIETPIDRAFASSSAASFLLGIGNLQRDFDASIPAKVPADGLVHVSLRAKDTGGVIELGLDAKTYDIATLRLTDQLGDATMLKFTDLKRNIALDPGLFVFKIPAGVDIVTSPPGL
jgi:outer membrane lipoprotein carrier protein